MNDRRPPGGGFMNEKITIRWALIPLILVIVVGLIAWGMQALRCRTLESQCRSTISEQATQSAETIARSVAAFGNRRIVQSNWQELQEYADETVSGNRLAFIAIVDTTGVAVVHTNRSFRDREFTEPTDTDKVVHASVPAMSRTTRVATVWVGLNVSRPPTEGEE